MARDLIPPPSPAVPEAPGNVRWNIVGSTVTIAWDAPTAGGPVLSYLLQVGLAPGRTDYSLPTGSPVRALTQTTFGLSRDDAGRFLSEYAEKGIIHHDPFVTLDVAVGELMKIGTERGRAVHPDLKIGVCGEHGGDPETIGFCERIGLTYVSCSPYRVPVARLAAAQATLKSKR